jgi:hypothetical protein
MDFYPFSAGMMITTDGGYNWTTVSNEIHCLDMQVIDSTTMYSVGNVILSARYKLFRTFNCGATWDSVANLCPGKYDGLSFVDKNTGWISGDNGSNDCIWKTTDGGIHFTQITDSTGGGVIRFTKHKVNGGYTGWNDSWSTAEFWKTTNSGNNWSQMQIPVQYLHDFMFIDENTGWLTEWGNDIYKTTNGGYNWFVQSYPYGNGIEKSAENIFIVNSDIVFISGYKYLPGSLQHIIIFKTINGGTNWGYQEINMNLAGGGGLLYFINSLTGWCYNGLGGFHTTNGGGSILYSAIENINLKNPDNFKLSQNYPNPFNPITKISYELPKDSKVSLIIYDILGKEIRRLVDNEFKQAGIYSIDFNEPSLASGVYFYRLVALDSFGKTSYNKVKSMVYIK